MSLLLYTIVYFYADVFPPSPPRLSIPDVLIDLTNIPETPPGKLERTNKDPEDYKCKAKDPEDSKCKAKDVKSKAKVSYTYERANGWIKCRKDYV